MTPELLTAFSNFGYPALVSGVLLYIIISKLEKLAVRMEALDKTLIELVHSIREYRNDVQSLK